MEGFIHISTNCDLKPGVLLAADCQQTLLIYNKCLYVINGLVLWCEVCFYLKKENNGQLVIFLVKSLVYLFTMLIC